MQTSKTSTFGRYEILTVLGRGAMGVVYKALDPKINRLVAIKTISLTAADSIEKEASRDRFFREAEAAGRLSHPRIVAIFDVDEDPDTLNPYIVMEYVAGRSLEEILTTESARLPLHTTLQLIQEVAEALDYAHLQGVVHRDVKPSNVIIGDDGHARVADFGIAKLNVTDSGRPGPAWGTPAYMSPEQLRGESVDGRSDLFSLGVMLYRMLTGHRPFQGSSDLTVARKVLNQDPVPATAFNTDFSPELDSVVARAIAKNPAERYQTGIEMVVDLQRLRDGIESENRGDVVLPTPDTRANRVPESKDVSHDYLLKTTNAFLSGSRNRVQAAKTAAPVQLDQPWQQLGVAFLTLGGLALVFVGLWWAIPVNAAPVVTELAFHPVSTVSMATVLGLDQTMADSTSAPSIKLSAKNPPHRVDARDIHPDASEDQSHSCRLGIAVEHHFVMADLSLWIDDQSTYSHSLRGAIKTHVVVFKGVEGYLSDVVQLTPGDHRIRVRVLSADGSYDESGSISGTFTPGSEQLLAIGFDKHNRHMRLTFEEEQDF
ncbi:MAG: serine/threonine-protein kinase [Candidatus Sulfotelmatobacter sp.]